MRQSTLSYVTIGGLAVLTAVVLFAGHTLSALDGKLARALMQHHEEPMQEFEETVLRSDGRKILVRTTQRSDETLDDCIARHHAAVAAALA